MQPNKKRNSICERGHMNTESKVEGNANTVTKNCKPVLNPINNLLKQQKNRDNLTGIEKISTSTKPDPKLDAFVIQLMMMKQMKKVQLAATTTSIERHKKEEQYVQEKISDEDNFMN